MAVNGAARTAAWMAAVRAAGLALVAGGIDAYGLIMYGTYLSFMSGNTTQTGSRIGQWQLSLALPSFIAIAGFVVGVFSGVLVQHMGLGLARRLRLGAVAGLIGVVLVTSGAGLDPCAVHITILSLAMGIMNTVITQVGAQSINIGFVTGTLNAMANHLALAVRRQPLADAQGDWDSHAHRALFLFGVWGAFFSGAMLGGVFTSRLGVWVLAPPFVALLVLAVFGERPVSQATAGPAASGGSPGPG